MIGEGVGVGEEIPGKEARHAGSAMAPDTSDTGAFLETRATSRWPPRIPLLASPPKTEAITNSFLAESYITSSTPPPSVFALTKIPFLSHQRCNAT